MVEYENASSQPTAKRLLHENCSQWGLGVVLNPDKRGIKKMRVSTCPGYKSCVHNEIPFGSTITLPRSECPWRLPKAKRQCGIYRSWRPTLIRGVGGARPNTEGYRREEKKKKKKTIFFHWRRRRRKVSLGGPGALRSYYVTSPDTRSGTTWPVPCSDYYN